MTHFFSGSAVPPPERPPTTTAVTRRPRASYRLQLRREFPLGAAAELVDYLAHLGISHLYLSPLWPAVTGSEHGYDVVAHDRVREELGGEEGLQELARAAGARGMGILLDVVPNHVAASLAENARWRDLLAHGRASRYAGFFDVDWEGGEGRVLLPIVEEGPERLVQRGELSVVLREGEPMVATPAGELPISPRGLARLLAGAGRRAGLAELLHAAERLEAPQADPARALRASAAAREELRTLAERADVREALELELEELGRSEERWRELLADQHWALVPWREPRRNVRRFFEIDDLVALRADREEVFEETHAATLEWMGRGLVQGLRIDHVDGLADPEGYLRRLRAAAPDAWIVVEKILGEDEELPQSWPVDGTTGYDFLARASALLVDPAGAARVGAHYRAFTGETRRWEEVVRACRRAALERFFPSELERALRALGRAAEEAAGAVERERLRPALAALLVELDVYRTYLRRGEPPRAEDERRIEAALQRARRPEVGAEAGAEELELVRDLLLARRGGELAADFVERFQTLAPALAAKAVEDTALYRYTPLAALNEVGSEPVVSAAPLSSFHAAMARAAERGGGGLLATSTHDTKRGAGVRARLALLSECPEHWGEALARWSEHNRRHEEGGLPDAQLQYLMYQTLVGAFPIDAERLAAYLEKAAREAKGRTSWHAPDAEYEGALRAYVGRVLADGDFLRDLEAFVAPLVEAGRVHSLTLALLAIAAPGVPDVYQGGELWNLSLVDPDNRRPVDFALRRRLLAELAEAGPEAALARADEGAPLLWLLKRGLALRARHPELFTAGAYRPLEAGGERARRVVAFAREAGGRRVAAVAPRLALGLREGWGETVLELPEGRWHDVLGGGRFEGGSVRLGELLARFPVALLEEEGGAR